MVVEVDPRKKKKKKEGLQGEREETERGRDEEREGGRESWRKYLVVPFFQMDGLDGRLLPHSRWGRSCSSVAGCGDLRGFVDQTRER